jgi:hypothetical protein
VLILFFPKLATIPLSFFGLLCSLKFPHTLRKEAGAIEKTLLDLNPQGYRRRGRPKRMWRRTTEDEIRNIGRP